MNEDSPTNATGVAVVGTTGDITWGKPLRKIVKRKMILGKTTNEGMIKNVAKATVKGVAGAIGDVAKKEFEKATGSMGSAFLKSFSKSYEKKSTKK